MSASQLCSICGGLLIYCKCRDGQKDKGETLSLESDLGVMKMGIPESNPFAHGHFEKMTATLLDTFGDNPGPKQFESVSGVLKDHKRKVIANIKRDLALIWAGSCDTLCDNMMLTSAEPSEVRRFYNAVRRVFKLAPNWTEMPGVAKVTLGNVALTIYQHSLLGKSQDESSNLFYGMEAANAKASS